MKMDIDKSVAEPDVIDNRKHMMADVLNINLDRINSLYISSGYFDVKGYNLIREKLNAALDRNSFDFRLLIGKNAIKAPEPLETLEAYQDKITAPEVTRMQSIKAKTDEQEIDMQGMNDVSRLIAFLKRDNVAVRHNDMRFNHSKCYILGQQGALVGSSNFTHSGLLGNDELNAGIYSTETWKRVSEWFERMWEKAQDAKREMIDVLEQSKFGVPPPPYEVYMKILFEKYRRHLEQDKTDIIAAKNLAKFQQDAVLTCMQIIEDYGGVILADSTGLGKTHIGLEIIRRKVYGEHKKALLVAPAQIRDTIWESKLNDAGMVVEMIGTEELGRKDFDIFKYKKYDFVIIDESQNFRSKTANRRLNLMKIMSLGKKKQVALLTATPINNSIMDLYYQISIITGGKDDYFIDIGIPNLYRHMKKAADRSWLRLGLEKIQSLLDAIMVRRTRTFIREVYQKDKLDGRQITFPEREYAPIHYSVADLFGDIYERLLNTIESLRMAPYGIEQYNTKATEEEKKQHRVLADLQKILLLKRFESSVVAIHVSIDRKIRLFEQFRYHLERNEIISPKELHKIMKKYSIDEIEGNTEKDEVDDDYEQRLLDDIQKLPVVRNSQDYDISRMKQDMDYDIQQLKKYKRGISKIIPHDRKIIAVAEKIQKDKALEKEGKKVLIFTEYTTTAQYIHEEMKKKFHGKTVLLITGDVKKSERKKIIRQFSPMANSEEGDEMPEKSADMLVSTEVLAEGQNLQDCNYVVNYDLPWNPMRIVQRLGRIDRLTSRHNIVRSRECFPDKALDKLLKLISKLMAKIDTIRDVVGTDVSVMGQEASPKGFNDVTAKRIRAFAGTGDSKNTAEELERESDLMPAKIPINEIKWYIAQAGTAMMKEVPLGRRSGKAGEGQKAILAYTQRQSRTFRSVLFDYHTGKAEVIDDNEAITLLRCDVNEPKHLPMDGSENRESFEHLLKIDSLAQEAIRQYSKSNASQAAILDARLDSYRKMIDRISGIIVDCVYNGEISEDEGEKISTILNSPDLRAWADDLSDVLDEKDPSVLIDELKRLGRAIGVSKPEPRTTAKPVNEKFVLVGAMFISGEIFDKHLDSENGFKKLDV